MYGKPRQTLLLAFFAYLGSGSDSEKPPLSFTAAVAAAAGVATR
jgi:hypothetical protein